MERFGGKMVLAGGMFERSSTLAQAGLSLAAGQMAYARGMRDAEITRLTGAAQKQGYYGQAQGTLISGYAGALSDLGGYYLKARG